MFFLTHLLIKGHSKEFDSVAWFDNLAVYDNLSFSVGRFPPGQMDSFSLFSSEGYVCLLYLFFNLENIFFLNLLDVLLHYWVGSLAEIVVNKSRCTAVMIDRLVHQV
jgi:hypothetical protein